MRMPGIDRPPLSTRAEAIRQEINALPDAERRQLMGALHGDAIRRNDQAAQEAYERAERARNRKRPDPRQMPLMGAA